MSRTMTEDAKQHLCQCLVCTHARHEGIYAKPTVSGHAHDCDWHQDQYDSDCTCGAVAFAKSGIWRLYDDWLAETMGKKTPPLRLTEDSEARKRMPMATGLLDYFPDALAAVAEVSFAGNEKHNPGEPVHWTRGKSNDHANCIMRHLVDRGGFGSDKIRHSAALAWRALALLQEELEAERGLPPSRGSL